MVQFHAAPDGATPGGRRLKYTTVACIVGGLLLALNTAYDRVRTAELQSKYAEVLAHCANGGSFAIGETRLVTCVAVEIWIY